MYFIQQFIIDDLFLTLLKRKKIENIEIIFDDKIKKEILKQSTFNAVDKKILASSVSLKVCKMNIPSIIIYKMNFINFYIAKIFIKYKIC